LTSIPTYTNAGTYTIYYQVTASNYTTKTGSLTITINKASGSVTKPTAKSLTYSGSAQALVNAGSSTTGTIQYKLGSSGSYSTTIPTATNAGSYTVYYKVVGDSNHNDVAEASVSVTIATKAMTVSATNGSATYSGSATNGGASVSVTVPSSGYTIKYGTTSGTYDLTSIPTYTNAGTYTIYYQVTATNYTTKTGSFTITISKASGSVTKPTAKSLTYTGSAQALVNAGSSTTGTIQYKLGDSGNYSTSIPTATNAGSYTVYYKVVGDSNHNDVAEASVSVTIATKAMTVSATNGSATYSGSATNGGASVSVTVPSSGATIKYGTTSGTYDLTSIPTYTNAGTYTIYYQVTATNYTTKTGSLTITINKANGSVTKPTAKSLTYTGSAQALVNAGSSTTGTIQYKLGDSGNYSTSIPTATNAGSYTVYYKVVGDSNHNDVAEASVSVTIATKAMTVSATNGSATYSGSATNGGASVSVTVPSSGYTIKYGTTSGTYDLTSIPTYTNAGTYTIYYQVTATNYTTKTGSFTITIAKASGSVTAPTAKSLTYTGSAQALVNAGSSTTGTIQYKLGDSGNYSTTIPTATNAGTYTVYYKVVGDSNHNDVAEASVSVTIATKAMTVSATNGSATYSGSATNGGAKVSVTVPSSGYTIKYGTTSGTYDLTSIPTYTNAGTYTIYYQVTATNYTTKTGSFTITIATKAMTVSATNGSATYSGSATNGGAKVSVTDPSSGATIKYGTTSGTYDLTSIPTYTNAGTYTIYYQVTATNYTTKTGSFTITIAKASGSVTKPTAKSLTYTGSAQALVNAGSSTTGTIQYKLGDSGEYSTTIPTATNAGTYTVYYKVVGDSNHNDVAEASVSVTIATKAMTVSTTNGSATYSGSATNGGAKVSVTDPLSGATIKYGTTNGTYDLDEMPTYTNPGTYEVYYQVVDSNYTTKTGSLTITINEGLNGYTWEEVSNICAKGEAKKYFNVGDEAVICLGELPNASNTTQAQYATIVVGDMTDTSLTLLVTSYSTLAPTHVMNDTTTNVGGWEATSMRTWLNDEYLSALSSSLQSVITTHITSYSKTYDASEVSYCGDKLWLLSAKEVFGGNTATSAGYSTTYYENLAAFNAETQLAYFANGASSVRYSSGTDTCKWWLRSSIYNIIYAFTNVNSNGSSGSYFANSAGSVFPAFTIGYAKKDSFSDYTWSEVQAICKAGLASNYFSVGDTRTISLGSMDTMTYGYYGTLGDTTTLAAQTATIVVGDISSDGKTLTMLFTSYSTQAPAYQMNPATDDNPYATNIGGWEATILRTWLNSEDEGGFYNALSSDLKSVIKENDTIYSATYNASEVLTCKDNLWLLSAKEVFGGGTATSAGSDTTYYENLAAFNAETQLAYFANGASRVRYSSGTNTCLWWLRSSHYHISYNFTLVYSDGSGNGNLARYARSVFPAFCIG
jgi:hypothetical protein